MPNLSAFPDSPRLSSRRATATRCLTVSVFCAMLSSCILPYPHTWDRSRGIRGMIVDAKTGKPLQGAKIQVMGKGPDDHPRCIPLKPSAISGPDGRFELKRSLRMGWTYEFAPCHGGGPSHGYFYRDYLVSREGYGQVMFDTGSSVDESGWKGGTHLLNMDRIPLPPGPSTMVTEYRRSKSQLKENPLKTLPAPSSLTRSSPEPQ